MASSPPRCLRDLGLLARIGVAFVVLTLIGGTAASGLYLYMVKEMRDERAGLTVDDIKGHYHGMSTKAPLLVALESGHPNELTPGDASDELPGDERQALTDWLTGDRLSQDFDNFDLGDFAPSEIMAVSCLDCHARTSEGENAAPDIPLEFWDDVEPLSISRQIEPVSVEILAASTHTHALGLAALTLVLGWLALLTGWPRGLVGLVVCVTGLALFLDIGSWWATRQVIDFAYVIMVAGAVYNGGMVVLGLMVLLDLVMRGKKAAD